MNLNKLYLLISIGLAAISAPIIKWLVLHGGMLGISHPNSISFCNVFFIGNFCAGAVVLLRYGIRNVYHSVVKIERAAALYMTVHLFFYVVATPILLFKALELTSVTNLILLLRFESIAYAGIAAIIFKETIGKIEWLSFAFILVGIFVIVIFDGPLNKGDLFALLCGLCYAVGSSVANKIQNEIPLPTFLFIRNFWGSLVFFIVGLIYFDIRHFSDAFQGDLWIVMAIYGIVIVAIGQMTWYNSLKNCSVALVTKVTLLIPVLGIVAAYGILNEIPNTKQLLGAIIIIIGCVIHQVFGARPEVAAPEMSIGAG